MGKTGPDKRALSRQQRDFAFAVSSGLPKREAAIKAGYKESAAEATATRLLKMEKVIKKIKEIAETSKEITQVMDRTERMIVLSDIARNSDKEKNKIRAIDTMNKMDGLYLQRVEHTYNEAAKMSDRELIIAVKEVINER